MFLVGSLFISIVSVEPLLLSFQTFVLSDFAPTEIHWTKDLSSFNIADELLFRIEIKGAGVG